MIDSKTGNVWLERFKREAGIKSSIILHGNVSDLCLDAKTGKYILLTDAVVEALKGKGFAKVVKWDRVDGTADIGVTQNASASGQAQQGNTYLSDEELAETGSQTNQFAVGKSDNIDEFFAYVLKTISDSPDSKTAFIIDYSDFIFGSAVSLSEVERKWISMLGKTLQKSVSYNMLSSDFSILGNIVVFITGNTASIPTGFYVNNPLVSVINVPMPSRGEREKFIDANSVLFKFNKDIREIRNDLVDALDGFSLKEIAQMMKLSRQLGETLSFEKLINLYRYGEKVSPWEELSKDKLKDIEARLGKRVKGQDHAIEKVKDVIIRAYTGLSGLQHSSKQKKPKGVLFFVGPTGVGKTELAKSLAEFIFGDESACIRFDMSEFNHEHSDQRLVGAPPGYVGHEAGGQLTNAVKAKPFCVLLFDEIEKAHGRILDKFLQILEDGRLTDGKGETVYFSETIIIFTSNIGAADILPGSEGVEKQFVEAVQNHFRETLKRPELLNRIGDNIVAFNFISDTGVFTNIAKMKFESVRIFIKERYKADITFSNEDALFTAIAEKAGVQNGGRGVLNIMESCIVNPLSNWIFENSERLSAGKKIVVKQLNEKFPVVEFELT
jgi:DNA polymerase III delta prime subunit